MPVDLPRRVPEAVGSFESLPLVLDTLAVACSTGPPKVVEVVATFAPTFGPFATWRMLRHLDDAGIVALGVDGCLHFTALGRDMHARIAVVMSLAAEIDAERLDS